MTTEHRRFARGLRTRQTKPEDILWDVLRGRRLDGLKFRRQVPLLSYTVDFVCSDRKLIVELDGRQHGWEASYDEIRTREIEQYGFKLIRFSNGQVLNDLDFVIGHIRDAVKS
jgi:very-short-patch-repair endonuclease